MNRSVASLAPARYTNEAGMNSLPNEVARHWPLDHVVRGSILQQGSTRITFAIRAVQGQFVVKVYDDDAALGLVNPDLEEIDQHLSILDYLAGKEFGHAPRLLRTRTGARYVRTGGKTIVILEQVAGTTAPDTPAIWAELGRIGARLNGYRDYPHAYGVPIAGVIAELTQHARQYPFRQPFLELVGTLGVLENQPTSLIHGEINPANTVLEPGGRLVLVDWDEAGTGPLVLEAGYPLLTQFVTERLVFRRDEAVAFYDAYTGGAGLTPEGKDLVFTAALLHALRYIGAGGNPETRWTRIQFALEHRDELLAVIPGR
jgi:Ser/Thr protein kinase RdoA (MazF antagonist)